MGFLPRACLGLLLAVACAAAASAEDPARTVLLTLSGRYPVRASASPFAEGEESLQQAVLRLRNAVTGPEELVALDLSQGFDPSAAAAEELAAVLRSRPAGKRVSCLVDQADDRALILTAACDEIAITEAGIALVDGIGFTGYYLRSALGKMGIGFHAVASGPQKTAHEMFTADGPSPAAETEHRHLLDALDRELVALMRRGALDPAAIAAARAAAPQTSSAAVALHLADRAAEPGAWEAALPAPVRRLDRDQPKIDLSSLAGMMAFMSQVMGGEEGQRHPRAVAVVELVGEITEGSASDPGKSIAGGDTADLLDELADDDRIVAVVLRIDSPGGSAGASDRIHHAVRRLDQKKPVVALFDSVAASGGYYIGCAARRILVHKTTITGSIGVFALVPDAAPLLATLGIGRHHIASGPREDLFGLGPWTEDKRQALLPMIADVDRRFQALVAERRKLDPARVAELADGRVYSGPEAITLGLADGLGDLISAVQETRRLANIGDKLPLENFPRRSGLAARLGLTGSHASALATLAETAPPALRPVLATLARLAATDRVQVLAWAGIPNW